jgi:hypothetical protein
MLLAGIQKKSLMSAEQDRHKAMQALLDNGAETNSKDNKGSAGRSLPARVFV